MNESSAESSAKTSPEGVRPAWQTEPCPQWCTGGHLDDDHPDDRWHWTEMVHHALHLEPPTTYKTVNGWASDPADLAFYLKQGWREAVATVVLVKNDAPCLDLTIEDAECLVVALQHYIEFAREG